MMASRFVLAALAVTQLSVAAADSPSLPWLHGFGGARVRASADPGSVGWFGAEVDCPADAQAPLRLVADVSPTAGRETIVATLTGGIRVTSSEGVELATSAGYPCAGSADELEVLAAGSVFGDRTIVLAFTSGGRREQQTWLGVYRIGFGGEIDSLFAGVVETREDGIVRTGSVTFIPGALIYRPPGHHDSLWVFDPVVHTYTPRGPFDHEAEPHS
jgi:hypothetical protein